MLSLNEYLSLYKERYGDLYPNTDDAFDYFCEMLTYAGGLGVIAGDLGNGDYDSSEICRLVNYINDAGTNSEVDIDSLLAVDYEPLRLVIEYSTNCYSFQRKKLCKTNLALKNEDEEFRELYKRVHPERKRESIIKDRWAGFDITGKSKRNTMDRLSRMANGVN